MRKNKIVNRRSAGSIIRGITNIVRDLKSKPATTSGKQARRRLTGEDKPPTKTAQKPKEVFCSALLSPNFDVPRRNFGHGIDLAIVQILIYIALCLQKFLGFPRYFAPGYSF